MWDRKCTRKWWRGPHMTLVKRVKEFPKEFEVRGKCMWWVLCAEDSFTPEWNLLVAAPCGGKRALGHGLGGHFPRGPNFSGSFSRKSTNRWKSLPILPEAEWEVYITTPAQRPAPSTTAGRVQWWNPRGCVLSSSAPLLCPMKFALPELDWSCVQASLLPFSKGNGLVCSWLPSHPGFIGGGGANGE